MDRRHFVKTSLLLSSGCCVNGVTNTIFGRTKENGKKPNILVILTDQQTASAMSCMGNPFVKTPNMDSIAEHGTTFKRAYCPQPLCGPSRSSIFTGQYPHQVKATVNLPEIPNYWSKEIPMMGRIFHEAGYETGYVGKWHLPVPVSDIPVHGFEFIRNTKRRDWQDASIPADCGEFLKKKKEAPFLLVTSFVNPHDICEWARDQKLRMDEIPTPPSAEQCPPLPANHAISENEPDILREQMKNSWRTYPTQDWDTNQWRQYRWAYYRLIEKVDNYIGQVLESLDRVNQKEETIVIFTSDHGDGLGSHRWNQKQVLYEESVNVPFIISWKGAYQKSKNKEALVNIGTDLIPTICDYANVPVPEHLSGVSLRPVVEEGKHLNRDYMVVETEFSLDKKSYGIKGRAIYHQNLKYIVYDKGQKREQLFDLTKDPGEMKNLAAASEFRKTRKQLREMLQEWLKQTNDSFILN